MDLRIKHLRWNIAGLDHNSYKRFPFRFLFERPNWIDYFSLRPETQSHATACNTHPCEGVFDWFCVTTAVCTQLSVVCLCTLYCILNGGTAAVRHTNHRKRHLTPNRRTKHTGIRTTSMPTLIWSPFAKAISIATTVVWSVAKSIQQTQSSSSCKFFRIESFFIITFHLLSQPIMHSVKCSVSFLQLHSKFTFVNCFLFRKWWVFLLLLNLELLGFFLLLCAKGKLKKITKDLFLWILIEKYSFGFYVIRKPKHLIRIFRDKIRHIDSDDFGAARLMNE